MSVERHAIAVLRKTTDQLNRAIIRYGAHITLSDRDKIHALMYETRIAADAMEESERDIRDIHSLDLHYSND